MKPTHFEVKSDGLIYLIKDCPEHIYSDHPEAAKSKMYQKALASCERIECADQEQAKDLLEKHFYFYRRSEIKPGIYQVPVEWERKCQYKPDTKWVDCNIEIYNETHNSSEKHLSRTVAILKESPKGGWESNVGALREILHDLDLCIESPGDVSLERTIKSCWNRLYDFITTVESCYKKSIEQRTTWDTALTDAIVKTDGRIQPYGEIMKYLSEQYTINPIEGMQTITFFIESQKFETRKTEMTVSEMLNLINLNSDQFTIARKTPDGYYEYSKYDVIPIENRSHFQPFDRRPTYNA